MKKLLVSLAFAFAALQASAASLVYDNYVNSVFAGTIVPSDTYKCALVGSGYTAAKGTDQYWSTVATNEVTGTAYTAGGVTSVPTFSLNTTAHTLTVTFPQAQWTASTITARYLACYKSTGTSSTSPLVFLNDFGANVSTANGTFTVNASTLVFNIP